ncbi:MAG TPA: cupin domain-containing protein [Steroidobacteraceae bacterium]|jgi:mannose-6-phosphate isomerase-like protein (cupin superfamily)|nr:cupin domain-containing protein [Steroidobacteraceae bacterium]
MMETNTSPPLNTTVKRFAAHCLLLTAALGLAGPAAHAQTAAQRFHQSMAAVFHLNDDRGPLRHVDLSPLEASVSSEILAGPANGLDSAFVVYTRMAAGAPPMGLYTLPVEQTYLVLSGRLNVQIGTDRFVVAPDSLVLIPPGVPHQAWNAGTQPEADFEVVAPAPSRDLVSMMKPAPARAVANAAQYVHVPPPLGKLVRGAGHAALNERTLADRTTGSEFMERIGEVLPGSKSEPSHIHPFDQIYFVRRGTMTLFYGLATYQAHADTLTVVPKGVVHHDANGGSTPESFIQLNLPQPGPGVPFGVHVVIERSPARARP